MTWLEVRIATFMRPLIDQNKLCTTEMRFILCISCKAEPRQGQVEQFSKSKKKFQQITHKEWISSLNTLYARYSKVYFSNGYNIFYFD